MCLITRLVTVKLLISYKIKNIESINLLNILMSQLQVELTFKNEYSIT
jgi:hypothetical protein